MFSLGYEKAVTLQRERGKFSELPSLDATAIPNHHEKRPVFVSYLVTIYLFAGNTWFSVTYHRGVKGYPMNHQFRTPSP